MESQLNQLRKRIDKIDSDLLALLSERMEVVSRIGEVKKKNGIAVLDEKRWKQILGNYTAKAQSLKLPEKFITDIYTVIHKYALRIENELRDQS